MRLVKESAGDIKLCKFIGVITKKMDQEEFYDEQLGGYFVIEPFTYNTETQTADNWNYHMQLADKYLTPMVYKKWENQNRGFDGQVLVEYDRFGAKRVYKLSYGKQLSDEQKKYIKEKVRNVAPFDVEA